MSRAPLTFLCEVENGVKIFLKQIGPLHLFVVTTTIFTNMDVLEGRLPIGGKGILPLALV
jgi:hypothetical protein